jgi:hypothetical protein
MVAVRGPHDIGIVRDIPDLRASALRESETRQVTQAPAVKAGPIAIQ